MLDVYCTPSWRVDIVFLRVLHHGLPITSDISIGTTTIAANDPSVPSSILLNQLVMTISRTDAVGISPYLPRRTFTATLPKTSFLYSSFLQQGRRTRASCDRVEVADNNSTREGHILHEQEYNTGMAYQQSLMKYAEKYGVSRASRKYNKSRSYIYFWKIRWDGTVKSLACQSRRPHSHPNQHSEEELNRIRTTM